jgi:sugar lactone lactonase YvrE
MSSRNWIIIIFAIILIVGIVFLIGYPLGPRVPSATEPELFAIIEDTDGIVETPPNIEGIASDSEGNIYVGLLTERTIVKIDQNGEQSVFARIPGQGFILGLAVDKDNNVYAADFNFLDVNNSCNCIQKITPEGEITVFGSGIPTPNGLAFDNDGNLLVSSSAQGAIYRIDEDGNVAMFIDNDLLRSHDPQNIFGANGLAILANGTIFVANTADASIIKISSLRDARIYGPENGFPGADGLALDSDGNLYVAQNSVNTISAITPNEEVIVIAESVDSDGSNGELESPASLAFYNDRLYVSNADFAMETNTASELPFTVSVLEIGIPGLEL